MDVFPSFWRLDGKTVIVVGGGETAARKLRLLARTCASLAVFAPGEVVSEIAELAEAGRVTLYACAPESKDIADGTAFAVVATDDDALAAAAVKLLNAARVPVNAVDRTELCDFLIPSIVDRNPVVIGIATGGAAPILARRVRETLEAVLPARLGALARFSKKFRGAVSATIHDGTRRRAFWERFFEGPIARQVLEGREDDASEAMLTALNGRAAQADPDGAVTLIELDPEETDLLSLRALRRMQRADLVLHASEFGPTALELVRRDADRVAFSEPTDGLAKAGTARAAGKTVVVLALPGSLPPSRHETLLHNGGHEPSILCA